MGNLKRRIAGLEREVKPPPKPLPWRMVRAVNRHGCESVWWCPPGGVPGDGRSICSGRLGPGLSLDDL
jgi:hypothetical protein